ncbi:unnamed protein product [Vitrella brassicaformis CCMP3155]|uniref:PARP catalytic domain-containing protein n=1 Tax=Vitrella brassicaformis (strain CCMP3155) TaxID=1169540 RepID=A0A0G4F6D3_VITBC|nr:unnamed protein product [Vitrella brassicaformis CCMP3155]|eukprot:CEM07820.1 unnamed protein product [Vitrella brassicaformis CCMP3155]
MMAKSYDYIYEGSTSDANKQDGKRGDEDFFPPAGCFKYAFKVPIGTWLDRDNGWPVAYHGTAEAAVEGIIKKGLLINGGAATPPHGAACGRGIYASQTLDRALGHAEAFKLSFHGNVKVVFLVRVRPGSMSKHCGGKVWVVDDEENVRVVAMLVVPV